MRQKSKLFLTIMALVLAVSILFTAVSCNKKTGNADPDAEYAVLQPKGIQNVYGGKTADENKTIQDSNLTTPYNAFTTLMDALGKTSKEHIDKMFKNNKTLSQEIVTIARYDFDSKSNNKKHIKTVKVTSKSNLNFEDLSKNESMFSFTIELLKDSVNVNDPELDEFDSSNYDLVAGFYYQNGALLFTSSDKKGGYLPPLYISDINFNQIYKYATNYGFDEYIRKVLQGLVTNNLAITVGGNTIKIIEFIGPIIFPMIFNSDVKIESNGRGGKIYTMEFNGKKFVESIAPLLARVPDILGSFIKNNDIIKSLPKVFDALIGKFTNGAVTLEDVKSYDLSNFTRALTYEIDVDGRLLSVGSRGVTPLLRNVRVTKSASVNWSSIDLDTLLAGYKIDGRAYNSNDFHEGGLLPLNIAMLVKNELTRDSGGNQGNEFVFEKLQKTKKIDTVAIFDDPLINNPIKFDFPENIAIAFSDVKSIVGTDREFNLGKLDLQIGLKLHTEKERRIKLDELLGINNSNREELISQLRSLASPFYNALGLTDSAQQTESALVQAFQKKQRELLEIINSSTASNDEIAEASIALKELRKLNAEYQSTKIFESLIKNLSTREMWMSSGDHGFKIKIRGDLRINKDIYQSTLAVELTDTTAQENMLFGIYLIPGADPSKKLSDVLIDLSGLGMSRLKLGSLNLNELIYAPFDKKVKEILGQLSSNGLIGFIMGLVEKKDSGASANASANAQSSLNALASSRAQIVKLSANEKGLYAEYGNILQTALALGGNNNNLIDAVTAIINDPETTAKNGKLTINLSGENLAALVTGIKGLLKEPNAKTEILLFGIGNLLNNAIKKIQLQVGALEYKGSYSDLGLMFNMHIEFKDDQYAQDANTYLDFGINKFSLNFAPGADYTNRINDLIAHRNDFVSLTEVESVTVSADLKMALNSKDFVEAVVGGEKNKIELFKFLKKLDPNGIGKQIRDLENLYKDTLNLNVINEAGFNFAIRVLLSLSVNIKTLDAMGITEEEFSKISTFDALKTLFTKAEINNLLKSMVVRADVYTTTNIEYVMDVNAQTWRPDQNWDRKLATIYYDSDKLTEEGKLEEVGYLYIDFADQSMPDLKQSVNLVKLLREKIIEGLNKPKDAQKPEVTPNNPGNTEESKKGKGKLDAVNLIIGALGGINFSTNAFYIRLTDTFLSIIIGAIMPDSQLTAADMPSLAVGVGMSYGSAGIGINLDITNIKLNPNANTALTALVSINEFRIAVSKHAVVAPLTSAQKAQFTEIDALVNSLNKDALLSSTNGKYVGINTRIEATLEVGKEGSPDYQTDFANFINKLNGYLTEYYNGKLSITEADRKVLQFVQNFKALLTVNGAGTQLHVRVDLIGSVNIVGLVKAIDDLQKADAMSANTAAEWQTKAEKKTNAIQTLIKAIDLMVVVQVRGKASDPVIRQLTLYIDGPSNEVYVRLFTRAEQVGGDTDTKFKIDLNDAKVWVMMQRLLFAPKLDSATSGTSNYMLEGPLAIGPKQASGAQDILYFLGLKLKGYLEVLKSKLTATSVLAMVSQVKLTKDGLGIVTSEAVIKMLLKLAGLDSLSYPNVKVGVDVNLFPEKDADGKGGGFVDLGLVIDVSDYATNGQDLVGLFTIGLKVKNLEVGLAFDDVADTDPVKAAKIASLSPKNKLTEDELFSEDYFNDYLSAYTSISAISYFTVGFNVALNISSENDGIKNLLNNFGLKYNKDLETIFGLSEHEYLQISLKIDVPLGKVVQQVIAKANSDSHKFTELMTEAGKKALQKDIIASAINEVLSSLRVLIKLESIQTDGNYNIQKTKTILSMYVEGPELGDFLFVKSTALGLPKEGILVKGVLNKIMPSLHSVINKAINKDSSKSSSSKTTASGGLNNIISTIGNMLNAIPNPAPNNMEDVLVEVMNGRFSAKVKGSLVGFILNIAGVSLGDIDLQRIVNHVGVELITDSKNFDSQFGISLGLTGLKALGNNKYKMVEAISAKLLFGGLFISAATSSAPLDEIPTEGANKPHIIDLNSTSNQYFTLGTDFALDLNGNFADINWAPSVDLIAEVIKNIPAVSEALDAGRKKQLDSLLGIIKKILSDENTSLKALSSGEYRIRLNARINVKDIFDYIERRTRNVANAVVGLTSGTPEYIKAEKTAILNTDFKLSYAAISLGILVNGSQIFKLTYDSNFVVDNRAVRLPSDFIGEIGSALIIEGSETGAPVTVLQGKKIYVSLKNVGVNIVDIVNTQIHKKNQQDLKNIDEILNSEDASNHLNVENPIVSSSGSFVDVINDILGFVGRFNVIDSTSMAKLKIEQNQLIEKENIEGSLNEQDAKRLNALNNAISGGAGINIASAYIKTLDVISLLAEKVTQVAFIKPAINAIQDRYFKKDSFGQFIKDSEGNYILKDKVPLNPSDPNSELVDLGSKGYTVDNFLPKIQLGLLLQFTSLTDETAAVKLVVGIKAGKLSANGNSVEDAEVRLTAGIENMHFAARHEINDYDDIYPQLEDANQLSLLVSTSILATIKSPEYAHNVPLQFAPDSPMSFLTGVAAQIYTEAGFDTEATRKRIEVKLDAKINLGDLAVATKSARDYQSEVRLTFFVTGYTNQNQQAAPIVLYTDLNDVYLDLSALNMPKLLVSDVDILSIIKSAIKAAISKAKLNQAEVNGTSSALAASSSIDTKPLSLAIQSEVVEKILKLLGTIKSVKSTNNGQEFDIEPNVVNVMLKEFLSLDSGFEDFTSVKFTLGKLGFTNERTGVQLNATTIDLTRTLPAVDVNGKHYDGGEFNMTLGIGSDQNPTKIGFVIHQDNQFMSEEEKAQYIKYTNLALRMRAEAQVAFEANGNPFMSLQNVFPVLFNKMMSSFTKSKIGALASEDGVANYEDLSDTSAKAIYYRKFMEYVNLKNEDASPQSGVYSKTANGVGEITFSGYLNVDLPLNELFTNVASADSKLKVQLKVVDDQNNKIVDIGYIQSQKMLYASLPVLGIGGIKVEDLDLLGLLKENNKISQLISSANSLADASVVASKNQALLPRSSDPAFTIKVNLSGLELVINTGFVDKLLDTIRSSLEEKKNSAKEVSEKNALQEKINTFNQIRDMIPMIDELSIKYTRPTVVAATPGEHGSAVMRIKITEGLGTGDNSMKLSLIAYLYRNDLGQNVMSSMDVTKSGYGNFFDEVKDGVSYGISTPSNAEMADFSVTSIDKIVRIIDGGDLLNNIPLKKIAPELEAEIKLKLDSSWRNGPLKTIFEIIDKALLEKTESHSGFTNLNSYDATLNLSLKASINLESAQAFREQTRIKLTVKLNNHNLVDITYIASENAIYADLERFGLMKVKVVGIDLLSMLGTMLFSSDSMAQYAVDYNGLALTSGPNALGPLGDEESFNKIRTEIDMRMSKVGGGLNTKIVLKISDKFVKALLNTILTKAYNEALLENKAILLDPSLNYEKDKEVNKKLETISVLKEKIGLFNFNDILLVAEIGTKVDDEHSALKTLKLVVDLGKKTNGGRIYKYGTTEEDKANSDKIIDSYSQNNFIEFNLKSLKLNKMTNSYINSITPSAETSKFSALNFGDFRNLVFAKDMTMMKALLYNVIQLITQDQGKDTIFDITINSNTKHYERGQSLRSIQLAVKRVDSILEIGLKGDLDISVHIYPDNLRLKIRKLPESLSGLNGLASMISGGKGLKLGNLLYSNLDKLFVPKDDVATAKDVDRLKKNDAIYYNATTINNFLGTTEAIPGFSGEYKKAKFEDKLVEDLEKFVFKSTANIEASDMIFKITDEDDNSLGYFNLVWARLNGSTFEAPKLSTSLFISDGIKHLDVDTLHKMAKLECGTKKLKKVEIFYIASKIDQIEKIGVWSKELVRYSDEFPSDHPNYIGNFMSPYKETQEDGTEKDVRFSRYNGKARISKSIPLDGDFLFLRFRPQAITESKKIYFEGYDAMNDYAGEFESQYFYVQKLIAANSHIAEWYNQSTNSIGTNELPLLHQHYKGTNNNMPNKVVKVKIVEFTKDNLYTREVAFSKSRSKLNLDVKKLIDRIEIDTNKPSITTLKNTHINVSSGVALNVKFDNEKLGELLMFLNKLLINKGGQGMHSYNSATGRFTNNIYNSVLINGKETNNISEYGYNAVMGLLDDILYQKAAGVMSGFGSTIFTTLKKAIKDIVFKLLPLPNATKIEEAYVKVLLDFAGPSLLKAVHLKIRAQGSDDWELVLENNGVRLLPVLEITETLNLNGVGKIKDIYDIKGIAKAYVEMKPAKDNAKVKISDTVTDYPVTIGYTLNPEKTNLNPLVSTDEDPTNKLTYSAYAANLPIPGTNLSIVLPKTAVRIPKVVDNKYELFVKKVSANGIETWSRFDYSLFKDIKPGIKKLVIDKYLSDIKRIGLVMTSYDNSNNVIDVKKNNYNKNIEVDSTNHVVYVFGEGQTKFKFDTSNIPNSLREFEKFDSNNNFISLTYGNGMVRDVRLKLPMSIRNVTLDEDKVINAIRDVVKKQTTDKKDDTITNDPSLWSASVITEIQKSSTLEGKIDLKAAGVVAYDDSEYELIGSVLLSLRAYVQSLNVDYPDGGTPVPESVQDQPNNSAKLITLGLYVPAYRPVRIYIKDVLVNLKLKSKSSGKVEDLGSIKLQKYVTFDLYPPHDITNIARSRSSKVLSTGFVMSSSSNSLAMPYEIQSAPMALAEGNNIDVVIDYNVKPLKDLFASDQAFQDSLYKKPENPEGYPTEFTRFNYATLNEAVMGANKDNLTMWISKVKNEKVVGTTVDERKVSILTILHSAGLKYTDDLGVVKDFDPSDLSGYSHFIKHINVKVISSSGALKMVKVLVEEGVTKIVSFEKGSDLIVKLQVELTEENPLNIRVVSFNPISDANKETILVPDFKMSLPNYNDLAALIGNSGMVDYFYQGNVDDIRRIGVDSTNKDNIYKWIDKYNEKDINSYNDLEKAFKIVGGNPVAGEEVNTFDIFTLRFQGSGKKVTVDSVERQKVYITHDANYNMRFVHDRYAGAEVFFDGYLEVSFGHNLNDYTLMKSDGISYESKNHHMSVKMNMGSVKLSKGTIRFKNDAPIDMNKILFANDENKIRYFFSGVSSLVFENKMKFFTITANDRLDKPITFNRLINLVNKVANKEFTDIKTEEELGLLGYEELKDYFENNYKVKETYISKILGNESLSLKLYDPNPYGVNGALDNLNNGSSTNPKIVLTGNNIIRFLNVGDFANINKLLVYKNLSNEDLADDAKNLVDITISLNIEKAEEKVHLVSKDPVENNVYEAYAYYGVKDINNMCAVLDSKGTAYLDFIKFDYSWNISSSKDVLSNYKVGMIDLITFKSLYKAANGKYENLSTDPSELEFKISSRYVKNEVTADSQFKSQSDVKFEIKKLRLAIENKLAKTGDKYILAVEYSSTMLPFNFIADKMSDYIYIKTKLHLIDPLAGASADDVLSKLRPGTFELSSRFKLEASFEFTEDIKNQFGADFDEFKNSFVFDNTIDISDIMISIQQKKVHVTYKNISKTYGPEAIDIKDLITVLDDFGNDVTEEFVDSMFLDFTIVLNEKIKKPIRIEKKGGNWVAVNFEYKNTMREGFVLSPLRLTTLGAGTHKVGLQVAKNTKAPYLATGQESNYSNVEIFKKEFKFEIGTMIKYYYQDIDEEKIPIMPLSGFGYVNWEENSVSFEGNADDTGYKIDENGKAIIKDIKNNVQTDDISSLGLEFNWIEDIGDQTLTVKNTGADNYDIDIADTNANRKGIMRVKKTVIKLVFKDKGIFNKNTMNPDPSLDPMELIYIDSRLESATDEELDMLYNNGIYEVDVDPSIFSGSLVREPGEKAGEYKISRGTLSVDETKYELVFVDTEGNPLSLDENPNAVFMIKDNPSLKVKISPFRLESLLKFLTLVAIAGIVFGSVLVLRAKLVKRYKAKSDNNDSVNNN